MIIEHGAEVHRRCIKMFEVGSLVFSLLFSFQSCRKVPTGVGTRRGVFPGRLSCLRFFRSPKSSGSKRSMRAWIFAGNNAQFFFPALEREIAAIPRLPGETKKNDRSGSLPSTLTLSVFQSALRLTAIANGGVAQSDRSGNEATQNRGKSARTTIRNSQVFLLSLLCRRIRRVSFFRAADSTEGGRKGARSLSRVPHSPSRSHDRWQTMKDRQ